MNDLFIFIIFFCSYMTFVSITVLLSLQCIKYLCRENNNREELDKKYLYQNDNNNIYGISTDNCSPLIINEYSDENRDYNLEQIYNL